MDNPRALVVRHDAVSRSVQFDDKFIAFAKHWGFRPRACAPYRARTKGKTESGGVLGIGGGRAPLLERDLPEHVLAQNFPKQRVDRRGARTVRKRPPSTIIPALMRRELEPLQAIWESSK